MARSADYWKERMKALEDEQYAKTTEYYSDIQKQFRVAQSNMQRDIEYWYQKLALNNDISLAAAKKLLNKNELEEFHWTVEEYIKRGEESNVNGKWLKELENASAKVHINRLEAMKLQARQHAELLYQTFNGKTTDFLGKAYADSFYHTAYEVAKGTRIGIDLARIDTKEIDSILKTPWGQDGKVFSDRLWQNKEKLVRELHTELTQCIIRGENPDTAAKRLAKKMDSKLSQARTLVYTESAAISASAQKDCFAELDVEEFQIVETLDGHTCEICGDMDGKHFPMKEFAVGVTAPPFHPRCRGCTCPYFDDEFTNGKRIAREENGKQYYVPENMTYKEWQQSFVDGDKTGLQEIIPDDENAIAEYTTLRKEYNEQVQKLSTLDKEVDKAQDAYMDAMDTPKAAELEQAFNEKFERTESLREVVKDLKATLSGKEAKAVRQVEKNLADLTGIPIDKVKMTGLQYDTAEMIYNSYDTVLKKFPELKGNLAKFTYDGVYGDAYASCKTLTGEIQAHGLFAKYDNLVKQYAYDVAKGFHPIGTDHRSIIVHELGHALDGYMTKKRLLGADCNKFGIISTSSKTARDMTLKMLGFDRQEIVLELKNQGLKTWDRFAILEQREKEFISKHVSGYATGYDPEGNKSTDYPEREFFAECFAEYVMSSKPRKAAQIFGEIIETALGR